MKAKIISLLLLVSMVLAALIGCGGNDKGSDGTTGESTNENTDTAEKLDNLPQDLNFDGETIVIHAMTQLDVISTDAVDIVHGAIYNRELYVEDRLNVEIEAYIPYDWTQYALGVNELRVSIASGNDDYQIVSGWSALIPAVSLEGLFWNYHNENMSYVDLDQPYWVQSLVEDLTVADRLYFVTGDVAYTALAHSYVIGVNKKVAQDFDIPDLIPIVQEGAWTIDKLGEISKMVHADVDGSQTVNRGDTVGLLIDSSLQDISDCFMQGSNISLVSRDENDYPYLNADTNKLSNLVDKVYNLFFETEGVLIDPGMAGYLEGFVNDQALLYPSYLAWYTSFYREMENKSVLPWPKYDEDQDDYYTRVQNGVSLWSIPTSVENVPAASATLEALASYSYKYVTPVFFEEALKVKYNDDPDAYEMLDIVRDGIMFNFEIVYTNEIGGAWNILRDLMYHESKDFASEWAVRSDIIGTKLAEIIEQFKTLD